MQTRKDLYQAHRLMMQRLGMALLQAEPDVPESPMRRHTVALFCGLLIAALITAGFGIWGLLKPGNATKLTDPGQLLVEEESGAKYVYSAQENKLLPVANYVSARLLLDASDVKVRNVSAASLAGFARGPYVGIPGAPDSLPVKEKLVKGPWSVCVGQKADASGATQTYVTLVGGIDVGGQPVGNGAMVVTDEQQQGWVIWADQKMKVGPEGINALGATVLRKVPAAWINAIPTGRDFRGPSIPNRGKVVRGPTGKAARVGQIFTTPGIAGAADRWYVLAQDGLAPITVTQATLIRNDPASKQAYGRRPVVPIEIDAATANSMPSKLQLLGGGLPSTMPKVITPSTEAPLCAVYAETQKGSTRAKITSGGRIAIPVPATTGSQEHFDQILLPPGGAAMAGLLPGDGQLSAINTYYLISDQNRLYPLQSGAQLETFGYDASSVAPMPAQLLHMIPEGPRLDPAAAHTPVKING
ncbi:type VII secretion protein EccB [Nonomuraea cavernae]|uniref:Type VII secretion protein EccB n=1 Tax=Nonomuraea cavernae TaxID=2045107 RepID=A0A917ZH99_9ACTN|nr:type VII secretion protein EccB [Nonomuraea cavernae]MCA2190083.1 type VII secretion protein EccB [Nonomuraea cavernae]GGO83035.1 type VII secretion protein EccB [Nonomuraea cavernae]